MYLPTRTEPVLDVLTHPTGRDFEERESFYYNAQYNEEGHIGEGQPTLYYWSSTAINCGA